MQLGEKRFKAEAKSLARIAKEEVTAQFIDGTLYAFGSELATLRLLREYHNTPRAKQGYSENTKTFYFRLETFLDGNYEPIVAKP